MRRTRTYLALATLLGGLPLAAQSHPVFADGPAFGGSQVFPLGASPMNNPAALVPMGSSIWVGYVDGDIRSRDNAALLDRLQSGDPWKMTGALAPLKDSPWALRSRAYGFTLAEEGKSLSLLREEWNSLLVDPDLDASHSGSAAALALNTTRLVGRRAQVDRLVIGGATPPGEWTSGLSIRIERWKFGKQVAALNPDLSLGEILFTDHKALLGFKDAPEAVTTATLDAGTTWQMAQGIRLGATLQRLVPRRFGDVDEKPQARAGLQIDLGAKAALTLEADLNAAQRMPLPVNQKSQSVSFSFNANTYLSFLVGGERRTIGDISRITGGITVLLKTLTAQVGFGFQVGDDRPVKGLGWRMGK